MGYGVRIRVWGGYNYIQLTAIEIVYIQKKKNSTNNLSSFPFVDHKYTFKKALALEEFENRNSIPSIVHSPHTPSAEIETWMAARVFHQSMRRSTLACLCGWYEMVRLTRVTVGYLCNSVKLPSY